MEGSPFIGAERQDRPRIFQRKGRGKRIKVPDNSIPELFPAAFGDYDIYG
jgi:hypothetical protein